MILVFVFILVLISYSSTVFPESHKRKAVDEVENDELGGHEPPPVPPRKRAPPEKPPRRLENAATTAAEESLKQKKMVENLKGMFSNRPICCVK